jgi:uncharacterized coiled-coil DUF342 family protein
MKTTFFVVLALLTSGSATFSDQEVKRTDDLQDKKLNLLERLESGKLIDPEEVWSSFENRHDDGFCFGTDCPLVIPYADFEKLNEAVRFNMEAIRQEIDGLKNSDEFKRAMDEIRKGSEEIRRELEKMREEFRKSDRRSSGWENG